MNTLKSLAAVAQDNAPLGLVVVVVLAIIVSALDYSLGPVTAGYAHISFH